jgi:hypothetical protein
MAVSRSTQATCRRRRVLTCPAAAGGPWFLWAAVPLALLMLRRWIAGGPRHDGHG